MCSEGVSVWFACKLCKSFFLNADDFAYHKKKSHVQEFRNTKFIVFEEQTTPTVSPPENWVSFLSPKEETQIHKIISLPPPLTTINIDCHRRTETVQSNRNEEFLPSTSTSTPTITDVDYHPSQEIIQRNPNEEFFEMDPEINKHINDHGDNGNEYVTSDFVPNNSNLISKPTTEINLNCVDLLEIVKTEYESDGNGNENEDNEFANDDDHDPFESESQMESFEEGTSHAPNLDETRVPHTDLYCISCKKYFSSMPVLRNHYKYHHRTQEGKRNFECPYPNCGKTIIGDQCNLKSHIRQKHSSARPFKCPHPGCTKSFKVASSRNRHLKLHFVNVAKPDVG